MGPVLNLALYSPRHDLSSLCHSQCTIAWPLFLNLDTFKPLISNLSPLFYTAGSMDSVLPGVDTEDALTRTGPMGPMLQPSRPIPWRGQFIPTISTDEAPCDVVKPSVLCSKCEPIRSWVQENRNGIVKGHGLEKYFPHYDSGLELEESYSQGCHLCKLIWSCLTLDYTENETPDIRWLQDSGSIGVVSVLMIGIALIYWTH